MNRSIYNELLKKAISSRTLEVKARIRKDSKLLHSGIVISLDGNYKINTSSKIFLDTMIELSEEALRREMPKSVLGVLEFVLNYDAYLKETVNDQSLNVFNFVIDPFIVQAFVRLHSEGRADIISFYYSLAEHKQTHRKLLWNYESYFFEALVNLDLKVGQINKILIASSDERTRQHDILEKNKFLTRLPEINFTLALDLYKYGKRKGLDKAENFLAVLLASLYKRGFEYAIKEAKLLFKSNQKLAVVFFGAIEYKSTTLVDYVIGLQSELDKENIDLCCNYTFTLSKLLNQSIVDYKQADEIFKSLLTLVSMQNEAISNCVAGVLTWQVKGREEQRFKFLKTVLYNNLIKATILKNYFHNFSNPQFFFDLFSEMYAALGRRLNFDLFEDGLDHFMDENYQSTENRILGQLTNENIRVRLGMVELWLRSSRRRTVLNSLALNSELEQLRFIEVLTMYPYGSEESLPSLLQLRKSPFPNVVLYLQERLSMLVYEAYQDYLFDLISGNLENNKEDKKFLIPIREALTLYKRVREEKGMIKDIDPRANERSYVQLYYKLEAERNAKTMNEITSREPSFLQSTAKNVIIVRGNAWKIEERDVSPLGEFNSSVALDSRMFKNPDEFEMNLTHPKSQF